MIETFQEGHIRQAAVLAKTDGRLEAKRLEDTLRYRRQAGYSARKERMIRLRMSTGTKPLKGKKLYIPDLDEQWRQEDD